MTALRRLIDAFFARHPLLWDRPVEAPPPDLYTRADMDAALKGVLVPHLRAMGFAGSLPRFRRERNGAIELLTVSFSKYGGAFDIWIVRIPPQGLPYDGAFLPVEKVRAEHLADTFKLGAHDRRIDHERYDFRRTDPAHVAASACADLDRPETWKRVDRLRTKSLVPKPIKTLTFGD